MALAQMNRRFKFPLVALAALVAVLIAAGVLLSTDLSPFADSDEKPVYNAASTLEGGPDEVLFLSGTTLIRRDVVASEESPLTDAPSPAVYAAPGSHWLAYVTMKAEVGNTAVPTVQVYDPETETKQQVGVGVRPVWNPEGTHVAFVRPLVPSECTGEDCSGETKIGVFDVETGNTALFLDAGRYSVLGWAGDSLLVSDFDDPKAILSVSPEGEPARLEMPASQFVDASPDGNWILRQSANITEFVAIEDGALGDQRIPIELGQYEVIQGVFAHDSTEVAAITGITAGVTKGKGKNARIVNEATTTQIQVFSPESPEPVLVEETFGAASHLLWSVDNESVIFTRLLDPKKALFQANHCPVANEGECTIVTSWTEGVSILRAE